MTRGSLRASADESRFILRAELRDRRRRRRSRTRSIVAFLGVRGDRLVRRCGDEVVLRLSFPSCSSRSTSSRASRNSANQAARARRRVTAGFEPHERLAELLARATRVAHDCSAACRILFVEDNDFIRDVFDYGLRVFFAARGAYTVDHAESVDARLGSARGHAYDVAIVDYYLPTDTGADADRARAGGCRFARIPIVAVSVGGRDAREASLAAGADVFLDKPLVFRDLFNTLRILGQATGAYSRERARSRFSYSTTAR